MTSISFASTIKSIKYLRKTTKFVLLALAENKAQKLIRFLECVTLATERMTEKEYNEFIGKVESPQGRKLLFKYIEEATSVDSRIGHMALALLFCKDPDFIFDELYERLVLTALKNLDDNIINFFIAAHNKVHKSTLAELPYDRVVIDDKSQLLKLGWSHEDIALLVNHLINLSLLLPDPCFSIPYFQKDIYWSVEYAISGNTKEISRLFQKAKEFSEDYSQQS